MPGTTQQPRFSVARSIKLGSFHIGSSMSDLLTSAVWNRIMIVDLGVAAWPVALLSALRYLLAPLTLWAGYSSDTRPIHGSRRTAYILLGRMAMLLSLPLLPLATVEIAHDTASTAGWGVAVLAFVLYGAGTLVSGPAFLALVHDSAPYERRGQAMGIVQIMLVASFAFVPALYAVAMPRYDPDRFATLVLAGAAGAAVFWLLSVLGEERGGARPVAAAEPSVRAGPGFAAIWRQQSTRRYALFLAVAAIFGFMQDAILEPFGGDVFGLPVGETTRFNAYWGGGVLIAMIATVALTRRRPPERQVSTTTLGLALSSLPLLALAAVSLREALVWVAPVLVLFGLGFGVYTAGGVSLLMAMSSERRAGSYLALWSVVNLVARGSGIALGGIARDVAVALSGDFAVAYAAVFALEAAGLVLAIFLLRRVGVAEFAAAQPERPRADVLAGLAD